MRNYRHCRHYYGKPGDGLIMLLIIVVGYLMAMPFVGLYKLATGKDEGTKAVGVIMLVVGIIIYIVALFNS